MTISRKTQLSPAELRRYHRQLILPEFGVAAQQKLQAAKVLLIGAGGLGSPAAMYLAAAGVGTLGLVDADLVEASNLHRQILHGAGDVGRSKLQSAQETLQELNEHVNLITYETWLNAGNAREIMADHDLVVDGTDNFAARYLVNDACVLLGKPDVYGAVFRFEGQASVFACAPGPCYRCLYPEPPPPGAIPNCAEGGVLGVLPGIIGVIQATEAIKLILGKGELLTGRLLLYDALAMSFRELKLKRDPACPVCGDNPTITELQETDISCRTAIDRELEITPGQLKQRLDNHDDVYLLDVREDYEYQLCRLPGATLIPLRELPNRLDELRHLGDIVVYCRVGERSMTATNFLISQGFHKVKNLAGGILRWADEVDPSIEKY